jgi:hypothetical protein
MIYYGGVSFFDVLRSLMQSVKMNGFQCRAPSYGNHTLIRHRN